MLENSDVSDKRNNYIETVSQFIQEKCMQLTEIASKIGWTVESLTNQDKVQCQYNPGHWVKKSSLAKHEEICSALKDGYSRDELEKEPPSSQFFYAKCNAVASIQIGEKELKEIIKTTCSSTEIPANVFKEFKNKEAPSLPKTMERFCSDLTTEEKLAVYDYAVKESKVVKNVSGIAGDELFLDFEKKQEDEKEKSYLEILAEQRDYKRRRQSYRAKNVHITKKSYTEVMKEVIENQISYLQEKIIEDERAHNSSEEFRVYKSRESDERQRNSREDSSKSQKSYYREDHDNSVYSDHQRGNNYPPERSRCKERDHLPDRNRHRHRHKRSRSRSTSKHRYKHKKHKKHYK